VNGTWQKDGDYDVLCSGYQGYNCLFNTDCAALNLTCMDWQTINSTGSKLSSGTKCSGHSGCNHSFTFNNTIYQGKCEGITGMSCN